MRTHSNSYKIKILFVFIFIIQLLHTFVLIQHLNFHTPVYACSITPHASMLLPCTMLKVLSPTLAMLGPFTLKPNVPALTPDDTDSTKLEGPAQLPLFFYSNGIKQRTPYYHFGNRDPATEKNNVKTVLNSPSIPMLNAPALSMLDVPTRQSPMLNVPAHLAHIICSNYLFFRTLGCITSGPSNPHDPGPTAAGAGQTIGPANTLATIILPIIQFATHDFLCTQPRSHQCIYVMSVL
jgi:hypothetical protein